MFEKPLRSVIRRVKSSLTMRKVCDLFPFTYPFIFGIRNLLQRIYFETNEAEQV